ncbi:intercompartmental signaling factor BofC [Bacillus sp. Marseille-P3661]|uniref:intercompartmental signaling factor BofC n=1 Tax=Bacillus sp. Marseille-P3661 TaxID=1936234 RepID=UPI000C85D6F9|nr:intercompartmental signaling factor BofC [Bacillus sp. Marseille-P3661]
MTPLFQKANVIKFIIGSLLVGGISVALVIFPTAAEKNEGELDQNNTVLQNEAMEVTGPLTVNIILKRYYLDGAVSEETVQETIWSMEDFWAQYEDWQLVDQSEGEMVFKRNVNDISPLLKADGYFGISQEGILTIYKGKPGSEEVIQSFFQIDVSKLESRQQEELKQGIPVVSKDRYQEVIESFKSLSTQ